MDSNRKIPFLQNHLLRITLPWSDFSYLMGDYEELYDRICREKSDFRANLWIWRQIFRSFITYINDSTYWSIIMFRNNLKIAFRNLLKYKTFSFINISGLVLGITCCLLIMLYVQYELSYDSFHEKSDRIFRVYEDIRTATGTSRLFAPIPPPCGPALENDYPEVINAVRFSYWGNLEVKYDTKMFYEDGFFFVDPDVFDTFSFRMVTGDPETALDDKSSLVITESTAGKYFAEEDPMGKVVNINGNDLIVTGVIEDVPDNSHISFDFLGSIRVFDESGGMMQNWYSTMFLTYIEIPDNADPEDVGKKIKMIAHNYEGQQFEEWKEERLHFIQPITDVYLGESLRFEPGAKGSMKNIYMLIIIAGLTLFIACINFMSLSTSRSVNRAKEVGMRKVVGANRNQLVRQFLVESILVTTIALCISLVLVYFILPFFNELTGKTLVIDYPGNLPYLTGIIMLAVFVGGISGSYPAFYLTSFKPITVVRGLLGKMGKGGDLRKSMVVFQFGIAIVLIICTLTITHQIDFMKNSGLGFDKEQMLVLRFKGGHDLSERYDLLKETFMENPSIISATASNSIPGRGTSNYAFELLGEPDNMNQSMFFLFIDTDYISSYGMEVVAGRDFSKEMTTDFEESFILNEAAARAIGCPDPEEAIGKRMNSGFGRRGNIIGVVKDFNYRSLESNIEPLVLTLRPGSFGYLSLKLETDNLSSTMDFVDEKWNSLYPGKPMVYFFLDDDFNNQYLSEERMSTVFGVFTSLAIVIACLGLFGLTLFTAEQRTKEIGIRKTLGASVSNLTIELSKDFTKWVVISNIIAWPIAYIAMSNWLEGFAYRTDLSIYFFITASIIGFLIAVLTVSYQSIKAALGNPVDSLRYE
ncbi:MAG: FtsX-like permease family protein [bacterium]|nr:FtsX-like permease family protein [bacterium]